MGHSQKPFSFTFCLYWSPDQNVPVLNPQLARQVSSFFIRIRPTEPGDVRLAFPYDVSIIREAIYNEFQDWGVVDFLVPQGSLVLLNKIPGYPDEADEVFVNGELIGHRWYDPLEKKWRFRPVFHGVARLIEQKIGYYAIVDLPKLTRGFEVHRDRIVEAELPPRRGMLVAVQTKDGKWQALARLVRSKRLYIVKAWRSVKPYYIETRSSIGDVIDVNAPEIEHKAERARRFIKRVYERYGKTRRIIVSYSGGKDSLVVLDLVSETLNDYYVIFNDTTLELPDTYKNVHEVECKLGVEIRWARAIVDFAEIVRQYAPPARDFRYCCKMLKLAPISELLNKIAPSGSVSIVGQRKYESSLRARLPSIAQSRWVAGTVVAAPINEWTSLHVWLYILSRDLPYNKAYEKGFDRIGCWVCPANELAEIELARVWYPELYEWWQSLLEEIRCELKLPELWLRLGLWRWRMKYPGDMRKFIELNVRKAHPEGLLEEYRNLCTLVDMRRDNKDVTLILRRVKIRPQKLTERIVNLIYTLKEVKLEDYKYTNNAARLVLRTARSYDLLEITLRTCENSSVKIEIEPVPDRGTIVNLSRIIVRSAYCTGCGLCMSWCKAGAALIREGYIMINHNKCRRCGICNITCPAAEYLIMRSGVLAKAEFTARGIEGSAAE